MNSRAVAVGAVVLAMCSSVGSAFPQVRPTITDVAKQRKQCVVMVATYDKDGGTLGIGSGFIIQSDGVIVTNHHVIDGAFSASVRVSNGDIFDSVTLLESDKRRDLVVLKVRALKLPTCPLGDSDTADVGQHVIAIGNPIGLSQTVSDGIVSALRQMQGYRVIQLTAPISEGSSGGPLLNDLGDVIGVTTAGYDEGQNLNIAVPINYVKPLITSLASARARRLDEYNAGNLQVAKTEEDDSAEAVDGTWSATLADSRMSGQLFVTLIQNSDGDVVGTYTTSEGGGGRVKGAREGSELAFELTQTNATCPGIFKGKGKFDSGRFAGTYVGTDCLGAHDGGTITMARGVAAANPTVAAPTPVSKSLRVDEAALKEIREKSIGVYLEQKLQLWTEEDAKLVLGEPVQHRYSYDGNKTVDGSIFAYRDPTQFFRVVELRFDLKTKLVRNIFLQNPLARTTWDDCKRLWGDKVNTTRNPDGSKFYMYTTRRLNVLVGRDGVVQSFGIY